MKNIYYGKAVYDNKEINAVLNVLKKQELQLIDGVNVKLRGDEIPINYLSKCLVEKIN